MNTLTVPVLRLPHGADLPLPAYATVDSAGMDLCAAVMERLEIAPGERLAVPTGIAVALPSGYEAQVRPRSGLAARHGLTVLNSPGTVDADYRGEVAVLIINLGQETVEIDRGMRIAQLVVAPVTVVSWDPTNVLPQTARGDGGFGSTGIGLDPRS